MLNILNIGYKIDSNQQLSYLLYKNDLKIFTRTEVHLSKALSTVKTFTDDINMEFSLDKCAIAVMKGGKQIKNQNMPIDDKISIQSHEEAAYKYIGVDENDGIQHSAMKEKVAMKYYRQGILSSRNIIAKEYYRRVRLILRSELNSKNKLSAINALAVPVPT